MTSALVPKRLVEAQFEPRIDNMLEGLMVKSQQINHTLGHHNKLIPEIAESVERDQARITKQKAEMKKRLG